MKRLIFIVAFGISNILFAQSQEFTGRVIVKDIGVGIGGVDIVAKRGHKQRISTNNDGEFTLTDIKDNFTIILEHEDFIRRSIKVDISESSEAVIELDFDKTLAPLYNDNLSSSDKETKPNGELVLDQSGFDIMNEEMLWAHIKRIPGLAVMDGEIMVRGPSSIMGSNTPVFIVDGRMATNGLNDVDPTSIVKIEALKGSAASMYGGYGATGVILVTTRYR